MSANQIYLLGNYAVNKLICYHFPLKYYLKMWNIEDNNKYSYCNESDALGHYFVECE